MPSASYKNIIFEKYTCSFNVERKNIMQDRAITEIGKLEFTKNSDLKPFELFTENPNLNQVSKMLLIEFEKIKGLIKYKGIDIENVNEDNYMQFAYRKGSSRGGDITFTTKFSGKLDTKFNTLISIQLPKIIELSKKINQDEFDLFQALGTEFTANSDLIMVELEEAFNNLSKDEQKRSVYSFSVSANKKRKFLSEFETIQHLIEKDGVEGNYKKYGVLSKGKNSICSICKLQKDEVFGFGSPFKYSTVDKPGTVSGFFKQKNNWINYPICEDCAIEFELGKNYISKHLTRYFFGKKYFLIPKTVLPKDSNSLNVALEVIAGIDYKIKSSDIIEQAEDFLMKELGRIDNNIFSFNLLFFEENSTTKAIKIKTLLEEIPPSRFRKLFIEIPAIINENELFKDIDYHFQKKQTQDLKFSFKLIKQFFNDNFYEMVNKIFSGKKINENELYSRFMSEIRANINKEGYKERGDLLIAKAIMVRDYLKELDLILYNK